jgi:two-component system, sensor histidine kinase
MTAHGKTKPDDAGAVLELICAEARAPLEGIVAVAERLARQPMPADGQACVQTIVDTAGALLRRFDQALLFAAGRAGRIELDIATIQPRTIVDAVQAEWAPRSSRGVTLMVAYDGDPDLACRTDGARLKQLFDGLVGRALRVTSRGAVEASLRARADGARVRIEGRVRDAGPAPADAQLESLFQSPDQRSTGLSLPLARELVRALRGDIRVERNPGAGLTFIFNLEAEGAAAAAPDDEGARADTAAHVLVVDDNATNRMVAQSLCEMFDCTSEAVEDGVEAVEAARTGRFDLVLMDIKMPRMDGVAATRAIRELPGAAGRVPVIALTANADPEDVRGYLASGMCSVVEKPINPERLLQAMNAALDEAASAAAPAASAVRAA